jgi:uncharacterized protein YeaO (DUF488 family)
MPLKVKRAYAAAAASDGYRILVDRLWPRGVTKAKAAIDEWNRELAPSPELRKWFDHDPEKWSEFRLRYRAELKSHRDALRAIATRAKREPVTLLFGAKDEDHNNAVVLRDLIGRL